MSLDMNQSSAPYGSPFPTQPPGMQPIKRKHTWLIRLAFAFAALSISAILVGAGFALGYNAKTGPTISGNTTLQVCTAVRPLSNEISPNYSIETQETPAQPVGFGPLYVLQVNVDPYADRVLTLTSNDGPIFNGKPTLTFSGATVLIMSFKNLPNLAVYNDNGNPLGKWQETRENKQSAATILQTKKETAIQEGFQLQILIIGAPSLKSTC